MVYTVKFSRNSYALIYLFNEINPFKTIFKELTLNIMNEECVKFQYAPFKAPQFIYAIYSVKLQGKIVRFTTKLLKIAL